MPTKTRKARLRALAAIGVGLIVSCATGLVAPAQTIAPAEAQADRDNVVRGLEAQFQVGLIRERKLADDREDQLLSGAEARLLKARTAMLRFSVEPQPRRMFSGFTARAFASDFTSSVAGPPG